MGQKSDKKLQENPFCEPARQKKARACEHKNHRTPQTQKQSARNDTIWWDETSTPTEGSRKEILQTKTYYFHHHVVCVERKVKHRVE